MQTSTFAAGAKKVLVLDIINIDKNQSYAYLEASLTEAIKAALKKRFYFSESDPQKLKAIAEKNYIYRDDYYTRTAAMNFGLLARQDIVIAGGFTVRNVKNGRQVDSVIETSILILDIAKRIVVASINENMKADSSLFQSVDQTAARLSDAAKAVLPGKDEWQKSGMQVESVARPLFINPALTLRAGAGLYLGGWSGSFSPQQPLLALGIQAGLPAAGNDSRIQLELATFSEEMQVSADSRFAGLEAGNTNVVLLPGFGWQFSLSGRLSLVPVLSAGIMYQTASVNGEITESGSNVLPVAGGGAGLYYGLDESYSLFISLEDMMQIESIITHHVIFSGGLRYQF